MRTVLSIAGSDSGGGAGIQADIKTVSALGCYAHTAITAVTVQNTMGVGYVFPVPAHIVQRQIEAVLDDIGADAVKTGMLQCAGTVRIVASVLKRYAISNFVLDPVMVSTSGHRLLEEDAISLMCDELIPLARVITPNIPEAEILLDGVKLKQQEELPEAAIRLARKYGVSVLLKAGHLSGNVLTDYLYDICSEELLPLPSLRIETPNTHGTGCTLSAALAAALAQGKPLAEAAKAAKEYTHGAIRSGANLRIGHGHGPVNHFWNHEYLHK